MTKENQNFFSLDDIWENILSRNPDLIHAAIKRISKKEEIQIINHLQKMASEPGWHEEQRISARCALDVILNG